MSDHLKLMTQEEIKDLVCKIRNLWDTAASEHIKAYQYAADLAEARANACPGQDTSFLAHSANYMKKEAERSTATAIMNTNTFIKAWEEELKS